MDVFGEGWQRFLPGAETDDFRSRFGAAFAGRTVCVAGAAGDIGSALVKALAQEGLRNIVLLDCSEHGLFELRRAMRNTHPKAACECVLGSVVDRPLLDEVFDRFRPTVVFHAAAFKHVGLLEQNPFEAIRNNVLGTHTLVQAAAAHGVSTFVLLSTDKAVNPHGVMGASKRIAELVTVARSSSAFRASAIRLGNVIGSRGSVVPVFLDQIEHGRPLSVTDARATRYFLTRREAVEAILAAGVVARDGAVLVPELGPAVRVAELAGFLSARNGTSPLCFTGLGPGEKLSEDLMGNGEQVVGVADGPLTVVATRRIAADECDRAMRALAECVGRRDRGALLEAVRELVPEYVASALIASEEPIAGGRDSESVEVVR